VANARIVAASRGSPRQERRRIAIWAAWTGIVTLAFVQPLARLTEHAARSDLLSYIRLVPFVSGYLLYIERRSLAAPDRSSIGWAAILAGLGAVALVAAFAWRTSLSLNDDLALMALAYVCVVAAGGFLCLGSNWMASAAFPMVFLIFIVPLPDAMVRTLEAASVLASADVAALFFRVTGTPLVRDGTVFTLPGIVLRVAQECSGIHSSWVLFITSLVASHLLLDSPWRRVVLVAFVIPLGIVRNGFRILVIGLLCVHVGPHMIDSPIHHRGGPIFFALSLVPLFLLLVWLRRASR
jgi:exosortase C (VPDSG-CTERM-specific)